MDNKLKRNFFNKNIKAVYFSHDTNARNDENILQLRVKYGWEGYGLFWAIVEHLGSAKNYKLKKDFISGLAFDLKIEIEKLNELIDFCIKIKLLRCNKNLFWSDSLLNRMSLMKQSNEAKREAGKKGAEIRYKKNGAVNVNPDIDLKNKFNESDLHIISSFNCTLNKNINNIQTLFINTLGRNPNRPESEETESLIDKFGIDKVYAAYKKAGLNRFNNIPNIIKRINEQGEFILEDDPDTHKDDQFDRPIRRLGE